MVSEPSPYPYRFLCVYGDEKNSFEIQYAYTDKMNLSDEKALLEDNVQIYDVNVLYAIMNHYVYIVEDTRVGKEMKKWLCAAPEYRL